MRIGPKWRKLLGFLGGVGLLFAAAAQAEEALLLQVDDFKVDAQQFRQLAAGEARAKFYHFTPPPEQKEAFYRDLIDQLIDQELLEKEAVRRAVVPDGDYVMTQLIKRERAFREGAERWAQALPRITADLNAQASVLALKEAVEASVDPGEGEVRAFYEQNQELFVEPSRYRVGLILLAVPPWERDPAWQQVEEEARALLAALREGADFAELAREVSDDPSAESGGDMGYLHRGMLGNQVQETVLGLEQVGGLSEPLRVLEGVVIVKLLDKQEEQQRAFGEVAERARNLLVRQLQQERWKALKEGLRSEARIHLDEALLANILSE